MADRNERDKEVREHPVMLAWYAAGALDSWTARQIEEHAQGCPSCRIEIEALGSMGATLRRHDGTDHLEVSDLIGFASGALPKGQDAAAVGRHLAACATCTEDLETLRAARKEYESASPEADRTVPEGAAGSQGATARWRWAFFAAAAAVVLLTLPALRGLRGKPDSMEALEIHPIRLMTQTRGQDAGADLPGAGPWLIEIVLPFGAPSGEYDVHIVRRDTTPANAIDVRARTTPDGTLILLVRSLPDLGPYRVTATQASPGGPSYDFAVTRVDDRSAGGPSSQ